MMTTQRNKRWLRKILYGVLILTGIVMVVLFYLIATFDIEAHRVKIKSIISQSLDREVRIDGKIGLEPSLWPRFVVEDISIGNPSWATVPDLVRVKRFEIQVALLPLLRKEVKILELNLIGAHVHLERDQDGTPNWLMKRLDSGKLSAKVLPAVLAMHIEGSTFTLHLKERPPITLSIDELDTNMEMDEPFKVEGNLIYKDIPIGLSLRGGQLHQLLSQDSRWPIHGNILIGALPISLDGFISDPVRLQEIQLKIATGHSRDDRFKSRFDGRLHEVGDVSVNLEVTAVEAGHRVMIRSKASKLDLTGLMSINRFKPVSGVKLNSFASTFESEGRTVNDIIMNSRLSLIAKKGEVHWHPLNVKQSKILHIESIEMQAEPRQAMKVQIQSSLESVQAKLILKYDRIINLIWSDKPWRFQVHVQTAGVAAGVIAKVHRPLEKRLITGTVNVKIAHLKQIEKLFRRKLPGWDPASATGKFVFRNNHLRVTDFQGTFAKAALHGGMALRIGRPAKLSLHLLAKEFDVENLILKPYPDTGIFIKANDVKLVAEGSGNSIIESFFLARWELTAQRGRIRWRNRITSSQYDFNVNGFAAISDQNQAIRLSLKSQRHDVAMKLRGHLGRLSELISKEKPFPLNFRLKADDMTAEFTGFLQKPLQNFAVVGGLEIQAEQLTTLIRLLGQDWERNQPLTVSGQLDYKPREMYLREVKLVTEGVSMTGEVAYVSDDSPRCDIHLQTNVIDHSKYIKPVDKTKNGIPASTLTEKAQRVIPDVSLNTSLLKSLSTAIQIDDLKVMHGATHITTIKAKLSIVNGVLSLLPLEARSPTGSSSHASLVLDTSVEPLQAALFINTEDLDYGLILNNMGITKDVVGTLNLKLDLKGQGLRLRELLGNANGDLEIVADKGRIPKRLLELWGGGLVRLLIPTTWFEKDVTDLNCAVGRFEINDGIIKSNLLLADTERITVAGETVVDLKTEQVSGLFKPKNKKPVLFRLGTPIKVTGTLAEIKAEPAQSGLVTLGKFILGLSHPGALILLFGDLGMTEKNPCEALLHQPLSNNQSGMQQ